MKFILRGVIILSGIIIVFMLITACAPNRALTRDNPRERDEIGYDKLDDEFSYHDQERDDKNGKYDRRRAYRERERENGNDPNIKSDGYNRREAKNDENELDESERFYQKGNASWYGRKFHGRLTASGDKFNMNELTAAHKTLPFGTIILVKNLDNGRKVKVKINDRGPYRDGRIIDLSFAAAREIAMLKSGEAMVGIKIMGKMRGERYYRDKDDLIEPVAGDNDERDFEKNDGHNRNSNYNQKGYGEFSIQAGAFYSKRNAFNLKRRLERMFNNPVVVIRDGDLFKVRVESIKDKREARRFKRLLEDGDISSFIIHDVE